MAVTLSVGLQKKVGLPDYGSLGASCHVEFEIDRSLIDHDLDGFHQKVAGAFAACRQAVNDQLAQQQPQSDPRPGNENPNRISTHINQDVTVNSGCACCKTKRWKATSTASLGRMLLDWETGRSNSFDKPPIVAQCPMSSTKLET